MTTKINPKQDGFNASVVLPNLEANNKRIWFTCRCCHQVLHGLWVNEEQMFFIGFEDTGDFLFKFDVGYWGFLPENE